jgi:epsin
VSTNDDDDLAKAIRLSKEEEELRRRELEDQNAASLFDDAPTPAQPQATGWNQGYQQQPAVDWFGNPLQQQPQTTGYLNNQYAQPQQTGVQNGYTNGFGTQPAGFDQFQQQQPQPAFLQQQNTIQPQQTAFNNNPYGQPQSNDIFGQQSPQQPFPQAGSHNPWTSNQLQPANALKPMPTGSNNPFAQNFGQQQQPPPSKTNIPTLNTLYEQQTATQFNRPTQPNPIANYQAPVQQQLQQQQQKPENPQHARLNALLASGEGQDTFGNVGDLRIPAQHTAPGTFVNSAGGGLDRLRAAQTGNNPFFQQQFTGAGPIQGGFGQQVPAQTGPAGGFGSTFGQQTNNPFGARPGPPQQSNSLIDL